MKSQTPPPSNPEKTASPRTLLIVACTLATALLTMGSGCPNKLIYGADQSVAGLVYEEVKEEYDRQDEIDKLNQSNEALQNEIDVLEAELTQIEKDLNDLRVRGGLSGFFVSQGQGDLGDVGTVVSTSISKRQIKQRRQDATNELRGLQRRQRQNTAQINRLQRGATPSNRNTGRNTAQQTVRGGMPKPPRTPVGPMTGGHAPKPPKPHVHSHH